MDTSLSKFSKLLILAGLCLISGLIFSLISIGVASLIYQLPFSEITSILSDKESQHYISIIRIVLLFNSLGVFFVPSMLYSLVLKREPVSFFKLKTNSTFHYLPLVIFLFLSFLPLINVTVEFNKMLELPNFLSSLEEWIKAAEESAMKTTKSLLSMESKSDLIISIFLVGIVPAISEELAFRGVVQQILTDNSKNYHIGIWVSAILFSAIHFQFFGFLPRMLLGAFFGYLFYWTKSIWFPIFAHFINNSLAVLAAYYLGVEGMEEKLDKVGTTDDTYLFTIICLFIFSGLLIYFKKKVHTQHAN